ncbi:MAG TPA: insulinase family protein [Ruminococcaceae bacterium]|nr:insulinase family protein [Oscillospiraceae bacterium]
MSNLTRTQIARGVHFNSVSDSRFKTMLIEANIVMPLSSETASANALLVYVLSRSCREYPTHRKLCKKLSSLYGAELSAATGTSGDRQLLTLTLTGLDDRYALDGESIAEQLSLLLCRVLFEPNIENGAFISSEIEQERRQLLDDIDSEFNDKRVYAIGQMIKNMCENETFGIRRYGTAEQVKSLTSDDLYKAWKNILKNAEIELMYVGDSDPEKARTVFADAFKGINREPEKTETQVIASAERVKRITEEMDVSQSKFVMGFRGGRALPDKKALASQLMAAVLGGTATSKLFCNVREKQSLCYYCAARYNKIKGIMIIDSGVEGENIEKLEQGIMKEIADMQNGEISDFELEATKLAVINSYYSSNDTVRGIDTWYMNRIFDGEICSIEEMAEKINAVTKQEVIEAAKLLTLDTVYTLKSK